MKHNLITAGAEEEEEEQEKILRRPAKEKVVQRA